MLRPAGGFTVRVPEMPRLTRCDDAAHELAVHSLGAEASGAPSAANAASGDTRSPCAPRVTVSGVCVHCAINPVSGRESASGLAEPLVRSPHDVLAAAAVAEPSSERSRRQPLGRTAGAAGPAERLIAVRGVETLPAARTALHRRLRISGGFFFRRGVSNANLTVRPSPPKSCAVLMRPHPRSCEPSTPSPTRARRRAGRAPRPWR